MRVTGYLRPGSLALCAFVSTHSVRPAVFAGASLQNEMEVVAAGVESPSDDSDDGKDVGLHAYDGQLRKHTRRVNKSTALYKNTFSVTTWYLHVLPCENNCENCELLSFYVWFWLAPNPGSQANEMNE